MKSKINELKLEKLGKNNIAKITGGQQYVLIQHATNCGSTPRTSDDCG